MPRKIRNALSRRTRAALKQGTGNRPRQRPNAGRRTTRDKGTGNPLETVKRGHVRQATRRTQAKPKTTR